MIGRWKKRELKVTWCSMDIELFDKTLVDNYEIYVQDFDWFESIFEIQHTHM